MLLYCTLVQQFSDGSMLSKRFLPAVLAAIVVNMDKKLSRHVELTKKGYQAADKIISMATYNGSVMDHMTTCTRDMLYRCGTA